MDLIQLLQDPLKFLNGAPHQLCNIYWALMVAQMVKNLPAMQETWVWSLGWEDPPEEGMATYSSTPA